MFEFRKKKQVSNTFLCLLHKKLIACDGLAYHVTLDGIYPLNQASRVGNHFLEGVDEKHILKKDQVLLLSSIPYRTVNFGMSVCSGSGFFLFPT